MSFRIGTDSRAPTRPSLTGSKVIDWIIGFLPVYLVGALPMIGGPAREFPFPLLIVVGYFAAVMFTWQRWPYLRWGLLCAGILYALLFLVMPGLFVFSYCGDGPCPSLLYPAPKPPVAVPVPQ